MRFLRVRLIHTFIKYDFLNKPMKITCNWIKTPQGNGIKQGDTLRISAPGASHISGAIYRNGFPVLAIFGMGSTAKIKVERKGINLHGLATLKVRCFDKTNRGFGIDDAFIII